ncbi:MAG: hypothetical protein EBT86_07135 [Actinobacteria bacterium]|nr:hypothetical protein [Actinomycetota bacterium]
MSKFQIDSIRVFKEGDQTVVKIPTSELERISKQLKPKTTAKSAEPSVSVSTSESKTMTPDSKTRILAPALGQTKGGRKRLSRRKTTKRTRDVKN